MLHRKRYIIGIITLTVVYITFVNLGREIPIHRSNMKVGTERIYYQETSKFYQCDVLYTEVVVYKDGTYEYVYKLISIGNGSCLSDLYIWDDFKSYNLIEAIDKNIVSLDDFLESGFVIKRPITPIE